MLWFAILFVVIVFAIRAAGMHRTVKAIDLAGLSFLSPVVRLCYRDEPQKQLREIGQFIGLPLLAIVAFLLAWSVVAQHVYTKSGKLPGPLETWRSATSVLTFHHRENDKQRAYQLSGAERTAELSRIEAELAALSPLEAAANEAVNAATKSADADLTKETAPLQAKVDELAASIKTKQSDRQATVVALTEKAAAGGAAERDQLLALVRANLAIAAEEQESLRAARAELGGGFAKAPAVLTAMAEQTALAEQKQYLEKMRDQLTTANQGEKISAEEERLKAARAALATAPADKLLAAATNVVRMEDRAAKLATAEYAKPATLPYQVLRSVLCVFCGFLIGSVIAIPLGILCGLSKGFMAALTPFIAVFKPVSPIVWLPVALIVVGGFIPDPDKHWLTTWLWDLPLLGAFKINPAFIASAITVALCSLWATMVNTAFGVASVDKDHLNVARVLRLGFWDRLVKIVFPSALPLVFAGLRISLGVGWMVLIAAELLSSSEGIGKFVWDQFNNGASDSFAKMMVVVFVVGAVGLLLDRMMIVFQRLVSFDGAPTAL